MLAKLKGVLQPNKEKSSTGAGNRSSAAPSAGPAVRPKDNLRPTSLPAQSKASRPKKHPGPKQYEGSVRLREVLGEPTKRRDHGLDESQMRLETQARHKDEERKKARDRSLSTKRSQSNKGSFKISKGVKSGATAFFSPAFMKKAFSANRPCASVVKTTQTAGLSARIVTCAKSWIDHTCAGAPRNYVPISAAIQHPRFTPNTNTLAIAVGQAILARHFQKPTQR